MKNLFKKIIAVLMTGTLLMGVGCKDYDDDIANLNDRIDELTLTVNGIPAQIQAVKDAIPSLDALNAAVDKLNTDLAAVKGDVSSLKGQVAALAALEGKLDALKAELKKYAEDQAATTAATLRGELATKEALAEVSAAVSALQTQVAADVKALADRVAALEGDDTAVKEIEALKAKVTKAEGDVATLTDRVAALERGSASAAEVEALRTELATAQTALNKSIADLAAALDGKAAQADLDALKAVVEALDVQGDINAAIAGLAKESWVSAEISKAIAAAMADAKTMFLAADKVSDPTVGALVAEMETEKGKFYDALVELVNGQMLTQEAVNKTVSDHLAAIDALVAKLESRVADLENRIQSLVYVPEEYNEVYYNRVNFTAASYLKCADGSKFWLSDGSAEMTFAVTPASVAGKLTTENLSIVPQKLTRAEEVFTCELVSADATTGKFTVKVASPEFVVRDNDNSYAIALNINIPEQGIDYTSSYLYAYVSSSSGTNVTSNFVVWDGKTELKGVYNTELAYTDLTTVTTFMDGFSVYYKDGEEYKTLEQAWPKAVANGLKVAVVAPEEAAESAFGFVDQYDLKATTMQVKTADFELIGDIVVSKPFAFNLVTGEGENEVVMRNVANPSHEVKIVAATVDVTAKTNAAFSWSYDATVNGGGAYSAEVEMNNVLTNEVYAKLGAPVKVELYDGETLVDDNIDAMFAPYIPADGKQMAAVALVGNLTKTTTYTLKAMYDNGITLAVNIDVTGMPELGVVSIESVQNVPHITHVYNGESKYLLLKDYAAYLWKDEYAGAFADKDQFIAVVEAMTPSYNTWWDQAEPSIEGKDIMVTYTDKSVFDTGYKPEIDLVDDVTGLKAKFTATVVLGDPKAALTVNNLYVNDGVAKAQTTLNGSEFKVVDKELTGAFSYGGELENTVLKYSIDESADDLAKVAVAPEINDAGQLIWNDWNSTKLNVKAELSLNGRVLTTEKFVVSIDDPVGAVKESYAGKITASSGNLSFKVASVIDLEASNGVKVFDASAADGLNADLVTALAGSVKYTCTSTNPALVFDAATGVVTLTDSSLIVSGSVTVDVNVEYTYQFGTRSTTVQVTVEP